MLEKPVASCFLMVEQNGIKVGSGGDHIRSLIAGD
jgi:hypothetical protein